MPSRCRRSAAPIPMPRSRLLPITSPRALDKAIASHRAGRGGAEETNVAVGATGILSGRRAKQSDGPCLTVSPSNCQRRVKGNVSIVHARCSGVRKKCSKKTGQVRTNSVSCSCPRHFASAKVFSTVPVQASSLQLTLAALTSRLRLVEIRQNEDLVKKIRAFRQFDRFPQALSEIIRYGIPKFIGGLQP